MGRNERGGGGWVEEMCLRSGRGSLSTTDAMCCVMKTLLQLMLAFVSGTGRATWCHLVAVNHTKLAVAESNRFGVAARVAAYGNRRAGK